LLYEIKLLERDSLIRLLQKCALTQGKTVQKCGVQRCYGAKAQKGERQNIEENLWQFPNPDFISLDKSKFRA